MKLKKINIFIVFAAIFAILASIFFREKKIFGYVESFSCGLYNEKREPIFFGRPGFCLFLKNGHYLNYSLSDHTTRHYDEFGRELWQFKQVIHHEFKLVHEEKYLLTLGSANHFLGKTLVRFDVLRLYQVEDGKMIHEWDSYEERGSLIKASGLPKNFYEKNFMDAWQLNFVLDQKGPIVEFTHANSVYEIPENKLGHVLKPGHLMISFYDLDLYGIYDLKQKKMVRYFPFIHSKYRETKRSKHDVQVLENGHVLYYDNSAYTEPENKNSRVEIIEMNPLTGEKIWSYDGGERAIFKGDTQGSVQKLSNGHYIMTINSTLEGGVALEVDANKKMIWTHQTKDIDPNSQKPWWIYRFKQLEISDFLKNTKLIKLETR